MTATISSPTDTVRRLSGSSVVVTLGRFEGRQMLRHPLLWVGVVAAVALSVSELIGKSPVLNRASMTLAWTMAPVAVAVALLAGWAVLRTRGRTDADPPAAMPARMSLRVAGVLVGLVWPAAATLILQFALLGWTYLRDPVTSMVWTELLVGPALVVFVGALAVAMTRWLPHASTPLVSLLLVAVLQAALPLNQTLWGSYIGATWFAPIAWPQEIIPYEVAFRPAGLHLGYLVGLCVFLAGVAVMDRASAGWIPLGVGLLVAVVAGLAQLGPISDEQQTQAMSRLVGDDADLTCETHDSIAYCAMPGYQAWIADWERAVEPMLDGVPSDAVEGLEVRQYPVHNTLLLDGEDYNNWWWIPLAYEDYTGRSDVVPVGSVLADYTISYDLTGGVARELIGCQHFCENPSQRVVSLWLSSHDAQVRENVEFNLSDETDSVTVARCMVAELWDRPGAGNLIRSNWETLTAPETTYEQAGALLGVEVPDGYDEDGRIQGGCS